MSQRNHYEVLGISPDADADAVRRAYKRGAMRHHPDRNLGDPSSEERFKELGEAYKVLFDPSRRAAYDRSIARSDASSRGGSASPEQADLARSAWERFMYGDRGRPSGGSVTPEDVEARWREVFGSNVFDENARQAFTPRKDGAIIEEVTLEEAAFGFSRRLLSDGGESRVKFPGGLKHADILRIKAHGYDFDVQVFTKQHNVFRDQGYDLTLHMQVPAKIMSDGGEIQVPRLGGGMLAFDIAPGTLGRRLIRLAGQGMPRRGGGKRGDMFCHISVVD